MEKAPNALPTDTPQVNVYRNQALTLLESQKTMVLAVNGDHGPWAAPVYYVYRSPGLYFFSSPRSKHIEALRDSRQSAGAIYSDGARWQDIKGLQMIGRVDEVQGRREKMTITARYLAKFPLARDLLASGAGKAGGLGSKIRLYVFRPTEIHCTNNELGFGHRVQIRL